MTREERRYWRKERIKCSIIMAAMFALAFILPAIAE